MKLSFAEYQKLIRLGPRVGARAVIDGRDVKVLATVLREDDATQSGLLVLYRFYDTEEERLTSLKKWPDTRPPKVDHAAQIKRRPEPGTVWEHYKGGRYGVMTTTCSDVGGLAFVIYQCEETTMRWARLLDSWLSFSPEGQPRFVRVR